MKAIEALLWIERFSISGEKINIDTVTEDMDHAAYYGSKPTRRPAPGRYLRLYSHDDKPKVKREPTGNRRFRTKWQDVEPDYTIETDYVYPDGEVEKIYLYKLED